MQTELRITIAICTYNRAAYLKDTLKDLAAQDASVQDFEIVVVNNNSTDDTRAVCKEFEASYPEIGFRMVTESSQGLSWARNRAIAEADSPVLLFIDDDVFLPGSYISTVLRHLNENPEVRCAGGRIQVSFDEEENGERPTWIPSELMPMFGLHDLGDQKKRYPAGNFPRGGNMLVYQSVFDEQGTFDTRLGRTGARLLGSEEKAFFERIRKRGTELHYWPGMELTHRIGSARLTVDYLRKQSEGIGESEGLRVNRSPAGVIRKGFSEIIKILGSLILFLIYLMRGEPKAAVFLLKFRVWVFRGFLKGAFQKTKRSV